MKHFHSLKSNNFVLILLTLLVLAACNPTDVEEGALDPKVPVEEMPMSEQIKYTHDNLFKLGKATLSLSEDKAFILEKFYTRKLRNNRRRYQYCRGS